MLFRFFDLKKTLKISVWSWFVFFAINVPLYAITTTTTYTYDDLNRLISMQIEGGVILRYDYDDAGNLQRVISDKPPINYTIQNKQSGDIYLTTQNGLPPYGYEFGEVLVSAENDSSGKPKWITVPKDKILNSNNKLQFNLYQALGLTFEQLQTPLRISLKDATGKNIFDSCYPFLDVCPLRWYARPIMKLWKANVLSSNPNNIFGVSDKSNRADAVVMTSRAFMANLNGGTVSDNPFSSLLMQPPFDDVGVDTYFAPYIKYAKDLGWISGCNDNKTRFCPADSALRKDVFAFVTYAFSKRFATPKNLCDSQQKISSFKDINNTLKYYPFACAMEFSHAVGGYPDGTVRAELPINRAELAKILCVGMYGIAECVEAGNLLKPIILSVSPKQAQLNTPTVFTVQGLKLPETLAFFIADCANPEKLTGGNAEQQQFKCTPSYSIGTKDGILKDQPNGTSLYPFKVTVQETAPPPPPPCSPEVNAVSPLSAILNQSTIFTVSGNCLLDSTAFWIDDCANLVNLGGSSTERKFQCTPSYSNGAKKGIVSDKTDIENTVLLDFAVDVQPICTPTITSISPSQATLDKLATFTVNGSCLADTTVFWIKDCVSPNASTGGTLLPLAGGNETQRQFQCTPSYSLGTKNGVVSEKQGGTVLEYFNVDVMAGAPQVNAVSPLTATLNQLTTFSVQGSNLPDTTAFWIDACSNVVSLGGTMTERKFQCTPSFATGSKAGVVLNKSGSLDLPLHKFNVIVQ